MPASKYESNVKPKLMLIEAWARNGLTEEQMCENLNISVASFNTYKKEHLELLESLKNGKEEIDIMVENALIKAALGYDYFEQEINKKTGVIEEVRRYASPNTTALIFWLKNRKPKEWRDKHDHEHSGVLDIKIQLPEGMRTQREQVIEVDPE